MYQTFNYIKHAFGLSYDPGYMTCLINYSASGSLNMHVAVSKYVHEHTCVSFIGDRMCSNSDLSRVHTSTERHVLQINVNKATFLPYEIILQNIV